MLSLETWRSLLVAAAREWRKYCETRTVDDLREETSGLQEHSVRVHFHLEKMRAALNMMFPSHDAAGIFSLMRFSLTLY